MKQFLLGLSVSGAFVVGCLTATAASDISVPPSHAADATTFEYSCHHIRLRDVTMDGGPEAVLNQYGAQGWRLIPLDWGDFICFERG